MTRLEMFRISAVLIFCISAALAETTGSHETSKPTTKALTTTTTTTQAPTTQAPVTTISPQEECNQLNKSCSDCLSHAKCLWCNTDKSCKPYPVSHILPRGSDCALSQARWGVCWVNFEALIIAMSVIGGIIILSIVICCCCCCCCKKDGRLKYLKDEAKWERQKDERKTNNDERRADRKAKTDEIRKKYGIEIKGGLVKDDNPYQRFDEA